MIDVVTVGAGGGSIAWLSPEGTLKVGPQSAGADPGPLCYGKGGTEVTITDAHVVLGRIPPHLLGGEIPLDVDAARAGVEALAGKLGLEPGGLRHRRPRDLRLEPGQRAAPGHGQARPRRPRLHAHHVRRLRLAAAVPADGRARHPDRAGAAEPRQRLGVRPAHRRREERLRADPRLARRRARPGDGRRRRTTRSPRRPRDGAGQGGLRAPSSTCSCAPPTCATSARPSRCGCRSPTATVDAGRARRGGRRVPRRAPGALRLRLRRRRRPSRSSGSTSGSPASARSSGPRSGAHAGRRGSSTERAGLEPAADAAGLLRRRRRVRRHPGALAPRPGPGHGRRRARRSSRSSARRCRCTRASPPASTTSSTSS